MLPAVEYQPVSFNNLPGLLSPNYAVEDFRRIRTELGQIREELRHHPGQDSLSQDVTLWCDTFEGHFLQAARQNIDLQPALQEALATMQRMFRCSLPPHGLLDETALLGSDGRLYSPQALEHFRNQTPEPYRNRSPLAPDNPAPFTTTPHPLAPCIARWLRGHGVLQQHVPPLLQAARAWRAQRAHQREAMEHELPQFEQELRQQVNREMERHEAALHQIAAQQNANLDAIEGQIHHLAQQGQAVVNELRQANQVLAEDNDARRQETEQLRNRLQRADLQISELECSTAQLKVEVNRLHEILNERESERNDSLMTGVIILAACIIIALMLPPAGSAAGAAAGAKGGAAAGAASAAAGAKAGAAAWAAGAGAGSAAGSAAGAKAVVGPAISRGLHIGVAPHTGGGKLLLSTFF